MAEDEEMFTIALLPNIVLEEDELPIGYACLLYTF